jgi:hypothetical protein
MCRPTERAAMRNTVTHKHTVTPLLHFSATETTACVFYFGAVRTSEQFRVAFGSNKLGNADLSCTGKLDGLC